MRAQAVIRLRFATKKNLNVVLKALSPETVKSAASRSLVKIESEGNVLILRFEASDTSALRAVVNSYLHWALLAMDTLSKLESLSKA
jgi:tRNA threonylcarbamoyladenosine modification (KEOPS) complex  Pcc1 subunit